MELGKQIKKYRNELNMSQDVLAEKVYVSRQTISNWENDKSYPDVHSLVFLSEVFHTFIDNLIKGDIEIMKEEVRTEDKKEFEKLGRIFGILLLAAMISPIPLAYFLNYIGIGIWAVLMGVTLYVAMLVEKRKNSLISKHTAKLLPLQRECVLMRLKKQEKRLSVHIRKYCLRSVQVLLH